MPSGVSFFVVFCIYKKIIVKIFYKKENIEKNSVVFNFILCYNKFCDSYFRKRQK